jgi:hypothetical protein
MIDDSAATGHVLFYNNGTLVCDVTSNLPSSGGNNNMGYMRSITTLTTATKQIGFGGMFISADF